jgi:hypothetical protein
MKWISKVMMRLDIAIGPNLYTVASKEINTSIGCQNLGTDTMSQFCMSGRNIMMSVIGMGGSKHMNRPFLENMTPNAFQRMST